MVGTRLQQKKKKGNKKVYMEMDEGRGEAVLALVEKNFGHLPNTSPFCYCCMMEDSNLNF
jgi:hypothetical protein